MRFHVFKIINHLEAIKIYEEILQKNQNNFDANSNLGMLYAQQNNLEKSEKYLNKAIKIDQIILTHLII